MAMGTILVDNLFIKVHVLYSRIKACKKVDNNLGYAIGLKQPLLAWALFLALPIWQMHFHKVIASVWLGYLILLKTSDY